MRQGRRASGRVVAIVPARDARWCLGRCLEALQCSDRRPEEVIVVDDGSQDGTAEVAKGLQARVIVFRLRPWGQPRRVIVGPQCRSRVRTCCCSWTATSSSTRTRSAAWSGSSSAIRGWRRRSAAMTTSRPRAGRQRSTRTCGTITCINEEAGEARTFWAGLGVVRRPAFLATGGFDERRFPRASIEDVELGLRLTAAGHRIALVPEAQGTHLKDWMLPGLWWTDVMRRAVPWSLLVARDGFAVPDDLNTRWADRLGAAAAHAVWLGGALGALAGGGTPAVVATVVAGTVWACLSAGLLRLLHGGAAGAPWPSGSCCTGCISSMPA